MRQVSLADVSARPNDAVRIMHTSDWHLGVAVRNQPRDADHAEVIAEICEIASATSPDLIIHTGDLFHGGRPGMADFGRAIVALRQLAQTAPVCLLAGNHDSSVALETLGTALDDLCPGLAESGEYDPYTDCPSRIRVHHKPTTPANGAVATYTTASGRCLRVAALPFVHANRVIGDFETILSSHATYTDSIRKICDLLADAAFKNFDPTGDVAVFASHLHVADARTSSEKEIHVSSDYATDPSHLESRYGYLAFGHIHIPQAVAGNRGRYAGSVLQVDFGEEDETKQVVVADLSPGRPTAIYDVALSAGRRLHRISASVSNLAALADKVTGGLVEVTVTAEPVGTPGKDSRPKDTSSQFGDDETMGESSTLNLTTELGSHDTLTELVHAALPDSTVVSVIDARHRNIITADDLQLPESTESVNDLFREWLSQHASRLSARTGEGTASAEQVASLFDEIHLAVTTDADIELAGLNTLRDLTADEEST